MKCPVCHNSETKVTDSRLSGDGYLIRRRRECLECNYRFSTKEEVEILELTIIKRDGRKESYSQEKIKRGIAVALRKRVHSDEEISQLIHNIEQDIQKMKKNEVSSQEIGEIVMSNLAKFDKVAYIRFASVYRQFNDVEVFHKELDKLIKNQ